MDLENQNQHGSIRRKKKQKQQIKEEDRIKGEEDRISKLPDPILHHILSFLPTKFAARTSILSKRWMNMWFFSPVLDFREWLPSNTRKEHDTKKEHCRLLTETFMNCVDKMLFCHEDMPNVKKFYLQLDENIDEIRVNAWISNVIKRKVEEVIIVDLHRIRNFTISPSLFTCESLTMLELKNSYHLKIPESIYFPRLKILRLLNMKVGIGNRESAQLLFSNCPMLEELILTYGDSDDTNFVISAPALKYLSIDIDGRSRVNNCSINIDAPCLLSLKYSEKVARGFYLHGVPSLVDADIDLSLEYASTGIGDTASKLIAELFNVKLLKMSGNTFKALSFADNLFTTLPTFYHLIHLEVSSWFPYSAERTLLDFLQVSPNLESLVFAMGFERSKSDNWTLNSIPHCLLLHLKTVKFKQFYGYSVELNAIKLVLKNAGTLEKMTVTFSVRASNCMKNVVRELLQALPRSSPGCVFEVS